MWSTVTSMFGRQKVRDVLVEFPARLILVGPNLGQSSIAALACSVGQQRLEDEMS